MKIHILVLDLILFFLHNVYMDFFGIVGTKLFLFGNNVIEFFYNMTFTSKMIINLLNLVAIKWILFHPPSCIKSSIKKLVLN